MAKQVDDRTLDAAAQAGRFYAHLWGQFDGPCHLSMHRDLTGWLYRLRIWADSDVFYRDIARTETELTEAVCIRSEAEVQAKQILKELAEARRPTGRKLG